MKWIALLAASLTMCQATAEMVYDAYALIPGPVRSAASFYLLVSMDACPAKDAPIGWMRGTYRYRYGDEAACWKFEQQDVKICPAGQYETAVKGTTISPCHLWPTDRFIRP